MTFCVKEQRNVIKISKSIKVPTKKKVISNSRVLDYEFILRSPNIIHIEKKISQDLKSSGGNHRIDIFLKHSII